MRFNRLNPIGDWWYLPTMHGLFVFDAVTGDKVAEWQINARINGEWSFYGVVNTLPQSVPLDFVDDWQKIVNARRK